MLRSYFKTAWRNLVGNKVYSALNILGLAAGMAIALLIGLWVYYQYSFDKFMPGYQQNYQVQYVSNNNGNKFAIHSLCLPLAEALRKDIPEISYVAQSDWMGPHGLVVGDKKLYLDGAIAGSDFLKIFPYELLKGSPGEVIKEPYSIVLTQSTAISLFGHEDPINKLVRIDNTHDLKVTGILKDLPRNSSFQFNYIIPFGYLLATANWVQSAGWGNNSFQIFVALKPNVSYAQVEPKIRMLLQKNAPAIYKPVKAEVFMHPMKDWHLYTDFKDGKSAGGLIDYVRMFGIIGLLVLLIACINFMNLSTARSEKRAKEVGIRKAIGSRRKDLILQFLIESFMITVVAFLLSLLLLQSVIPAFNTLTKSNIGIPYSSFVFWMLMLSYVLFTGLLSGSRPAFYLSSFQPVKVLKGRLQVGRSASWPRKILVVMQFSCSIALIVSTIIIYQQIRHAKDRPMGFDADRLLMTAVSSDLSRNYPALKNELLNSGVVTSITKSSSPTNDIWSWNPVEEWEGKQPGETISGMATVAVSDGDYFKTVGMTIKEGAAFVNNLGADSSKVILNEAAVKLFRFKQPLNQVLRTSMGTLRVTGVVKDALMMSPFTPAEATLFIYRPGWESTILYRLSPAVSTPQAIARLTPIFSKYNPSFPYIYTFADESYAAKFGLETLIGKLAGLFAALAIFISCLGLFGLAAYTAEQRTKEIGIRKVLGATVSQVWLLLSKDFIMLVLISCVIASPIAFYFLQNWLQKYNYRISIGPGVFIAAAFVAIALTLLTISFQAIRAALMNPAKSLRTDQ
ncbi:MAG TPA: ABC transporter permease [Puia sp.]|nr:ABC transporter permease [Puia sp.]